MNFWLIGIFILLIHDWSDFFLIIGRGYKDYTNFQSSSIIYQGICGIGIIFWIFCRLFCLGYICVYSTFYSAYSFYTDRSIYSLAMYEVAFIPVLFMGFMKFMLLILQIYWTFYILAGWITVASS